MKSILTFLPTVPIYINQKSTSMVLFTCWKNNVLSNRIQQELPFDDIKRVWSNRSNFHQQAIAEGIEFINVCHGAELKVGRVCNLKNLLQFSSAVFTFLFTFILFHYWARKHSMYLVPSLVRKHTCIAV